MQEPGFFIDTHVHLDRCAVAEQELAAARLAGIGRFVVPGVATSGWDGLLQLARRHEDIYLAPGLHPLAAEEWDAAVAGRLALLLFDSRSVAVGEIGLDDDAAVARELQENVFRAQLRLAIKFQLPVLIHCRRRTGRMIELLAAEGADQVGGIVHAFSGSLESARQLLALGFVIGVGGTLSWPNARRVRALAEALPAEALVLETDAPNVAPHPYRGQPNRPKYLPLIAAELGRLRGWDLYETMRVTTANARRVLRLDC